MTTIVFVRNALDVVAAWDSQVSYGNTARAMSQDKVFCSSGLVFGVAGNLRVLDVVRTTQWPEYDGSDAHSWVVTHIVPVLKTAAAENDLLNEAKQIEGSAVVVVVDYEVFTIPGNFAVVSTLQGYEAIGSGEDFALGALYAGASATEAVVAAANFDAYTSGPIRTEKVSDMIAAELDDV